MSACYCEGDPCVCHAPMETVDEIAAIHALTNAYALRIRRAVKEAGYDPDMLDHLCPAYVAAALALGVK